jgi:hypothetical protein
MPVVTGITGKCVGAVVLRRAIRAVEITRLALEGPVDTRHAVVINCIISTVPDFK